MKDKEIKKRIKASFSLEVPDVLDNILKICEEKKGFDESMVKKKKELERNNLFVNYKLLGGLVCVLLGVFSFVDLYRYNTLYMVDSIVELDVNPSIELKVNKDNDVIDATPLNNDGKKVLGNMDFDNIDLDIAVNAIIGSMIKNGYLTVDENSILVSVKNNDIEKGKKLQKEISDEIDEILKLMSIDGSILSQSLDNDKNVDKLAEKYDISEGKAKLINNIIESGITNLRGDVYTEEDLSKLSINDLNLLLTSKEKKIDNITSSGSSASDKGYISKTEVKDIVFKDAGVSSNKVYDLEIEFDCENSKLIYEIEFKVGNKEYDYEVDAKTSNILTKEVEIDD